MVHSSLVPTASDRATDALVGESLALALAALHEHGYVVIEDAVPAADVAALRERLLADLPRFVAREDAPYNWNRGNIQQAPPRDADALFPSILFNPFACSVSRALLGEHAINSHYTGNTSLPRSTWRQPVHVDYGHLWPAVAGDAPPHGLIVNVPLIDMHAGTGGIELWPGSHRVATTGVGVYVQGVPPEAVERRRAVQPPLQPNVRAGSILVRDLRLWHAGMPNPSDRVRPMVAMIHWPAWWRDLEVMDFPRSAQAVLADRRLRTSARFVDQPVDHARLGDAHAYRA
jgi:ectoine hydroxylase-related dioxygenase (phytanoyl-CoA dioxygenase family)